MNNRDDIRRIITLIIVVFIGYLTITNFNYIKMFFDSVVGALLPFILGGVLAFILNIPMMKIENLLKKIQKNKKSKLPVRAISIVISLVLFFLVLTFVILELVPDLISNIEALIKNIPTIFKDIENFLLNIVKDYPEVQNKIKDLFYNTANINDILINVANYLINSSISFVTNFVNSVVTIFTALVFAVYMLSQKEYLVGGFKKVVKAYFNAKVSNKVLEICKLSVEIFSKFVSGQCLESAILGCIFFVVLSIFRFPYALLIAVLTAITSLIPYFGAFIAMAIGAVLIATQSFTQAILFIVLFLIIQQIENNLIYPKVVGKSVGLSPIWTLLAITVGGSLFGIVGMIVGLPIASIIYLLIKKDVNTRLRKRNIKSG